MNLKTDEDYEKCLPELSADEYTELEKSIIKNGVLSPILVWNGYIVDGHNRYKICQAHHIKSFPIKEMNFSSKEEALEWILRNQLARRNLSDIQRIEIAKRYEEVISAQMKKRMSEGGGDKRSKNAKTGYDQMNIPDSRNTTKRKELSKIAGVGEGTFQRGSLVLEKGTPEQIERARKGGKGNSVSAIAREIEMEQKGIETRKCNKCGRILTTSDFYESKPTICKQCLSQRPKTIKDIKGNILKISPELQRMTKEEIIGDLYDKDKEIVYTDDDLNEELNATIENFKWSVQNCLKIHIELLMDEKSKDKVLRNLTLLQEEIQKWKELYNYE